MFVHPSIHPPIKKKKDKDYGETYHASKWEVYSHRFYNIHHKDISTSQIKLQV